MQLPSHQAVETNLRQCLLLKADDLYFTLAAPHGATLRDEFLGIPVVGLADENLTDAEIESIDLGRFDVARRITNLLSMLRLRSLSLDRQHRPDSEEGRNDGLQFLEHFLSTLPSVALGGLDMTGARHGAIKTVYELAYAWLNLIDTIADAFGDQSSSVLTAVDLALLSGLDVRTVRNQCGPEKQLRTSSTRASLDRDSAAAAFVSVHGLDAIDWLKRRKDFTISAIEQEWISRQVAGPEHNVAGITRGLIIAGVVNHGPLVSLAPTIGASVAEVRDWFDHGTALPPHVATKLNHILT